MYILWCSVLGIGYVLYFIALHITYIAFIEDFPIWVFNNVHKNDLAIIIQQYYDIILWLLPKS